LFAAPESDLLAVFNGWEFANSNSAIELFLDRILPAARL
jgi:hypothetical protein